LVPSVSASSVGRIVKLKLTRLSGSTERTLGELEVGRVKFATIERPWIENPEGLGGVPRVSCVPVGKYTLQPHQSLNFPNTYALVNSISLGVYYQPHQIPPGQKWGRSAILIHRGNRVSDVIGCIAIGKEHGTLGGEPAVLRSTLAMKELDLILNRQLHTLEIV
jgi:hypothetical protein